MFPPEYKRILMRFIPRIHHAYKNKIIMLILLGLLLNVLVLGILVEISIYVMIAILLFFRNPKRFILENPNHVLSPADGVVTSIKSEENYYVIQIFLNVFDVHVNRIPISGKIVEMQYVKGIFNPVLNDTSRNESQLIVIENDIGKFEVKLIAGYLARTIKCDVSIGDIVKAGKVSGIIMFGSSVVIKIPSLFKLSICEMQRVRGGESLIAYK